ncbi:hypothetical protein [Gordonia amicalis]|uniref:hypothetical protein n=1 Tax=Gordonia amicalis TaxID=89053 RepID=UPI0024B8DD90|nr:hypothetical protein [Gordonia amicalis]MDJ0454099.1 hypothetical protein [Gordonia amicalis]MDV7077243.1 hypothetical protein [Gordonia amicalis]
MTESYEHLAELLHSWQAHRTEIQAAYAALDFATARALEEVEVAWLHDIAEAAEAVVDALAPEKAAV